MQPTTKTALIVAGCLSSVFIVPAIIVIFHDFFYITTFVLCILYCFYLVGYYGYQDLLPFIRRRQIEEEQIFHSFHGDPEKMRFYKAFRKHFDGELNLEELEQWLLHHPRKH